MYKIIHFLASVLISLFIVFIDPFTIFRILFKNHGKDKSGVRKLSEADFRKVILRKTVPLHLTFALHNYHWIWISYDYSIIAKLNSLELMISHLFF